MIDCDFGRRMDLLIELMQQEPDKPMKKLQREAMKYFPLYYKESQRHWMSWRVGMAAAERLNEKLGLHDYLKTETNQPTIG